MLPDKSRRIVVVPSSQEGDLSSLTPAQFAMWENNELITDYSCRCVPSPPVLVIGVALPRFESKADPWAEAVDRAMTACVDLKRPSDPWCTARYLIDDASRELAAKHSSMIERDTQSPIALHMKNHRGFVIDRALLRELVLDLGQRGMAAKDIPAGVDKLVDITSRASGPRHLFVFFTAEPPDEVSLRRLGQSLRAEPVTLHGFAPTNHADWAVVRDLCQARYGSFQAATNGSLTKAVTETYYALLSRYEIQYHVEPGGSQAVICTLRVSSPSGCGQTTVPLTAPVGG